eukprot:TRINITY_DN29421_c0_g1_i5.p1 TRINITY_DN29421_c0_g1~~TRINITY_DN29421_c0_g1_i5.p1  ORF type:complete len:158 (-),score=15.28 TRINITY_DN29421_c0_g1_i5:11-484(-)
MRMPVQGNTHLTLISDHVMLMRMPVQGNTHLTLISDHVMLMRMSLQGNTHLTLISDHVMLMRMSLQGNTHLTLISDHVMLMRIQVQGNTHLALISDRPRDADEDAGTREHALDAHQRVRSHHDLLPGADRTVLLEPRQLAGISPKSCLLYTSPSPRD